MKKKIVILVLVCLLAICAVAFSIYAETQLRQLTVNVAYEGNVSVYVDGKYVSDAPLSRYVSKNSTVKLVSKDDNFMFYANPEGNTFGYEGEYSFQMMAKTTIDAWFENTDASKVAVIYKNTNSSQQILAASTFKLSDIDTTFTRHLAENASKFGYEFVSWNKTVPEIINAAKTGSRTIIVEPNYAMEENLYSVEVKGGYISSDNPNNGIFQVNTNIAITADAPETGKKFAYWTNKAGVVISNLSSLTLTVFSDEVYTAHFVDENENVELVPTVSLIATHDKDADRVRTYAQRFVPENYTIEGYGLIFAKDVVYLEEDMTLENVDGTELRMSFKGDSPAPSGIWTNTISCEDFVCVRAYITYFDSNNEKHVAYSNGIMASKSGENFAFMLELDFEDGSVTGEGYTVNGTAAVENGALVLTSAYLTAPVDVEGYSFFNVYADVKFEKMPTELVDIFSINKGKMDSEDDGSGPSMDWDDTGSYKFNGGYVSIDAEGYIYIHDDAGQRYIKTETKLEGGVNYNVFLKFNLDENVLSVYINEQLAGNIEFEALESLAFDVTFMDIGKTYVVALDNIKLEKSYNAICAEHNYAAKVTPPQCAKQGYTTYTCRDCGKSYVSDYVDPTGIHTYGNGVEHDGGLSLKYTCTVCGHIKAEPTGVSYTIVYDSVLVTKEEAQYLADMLYTKTYFYFDVVEKSAYTSGPSIVLTDIIAYPEKFGWTVSDGTITLYRGAFIEVLTVVDKFIENISSYADLVALADEEFKLTESDSYGNIAYKYEPVANTEFLLDYSYKDRIQNVLSTPNTDISNITGNVYYVSENGNDENDGLSPASAWKTLQKVDTATCIVSGDAVLFERGGLFRAKEDETGSALSCKDGVTYGCYGIGNKPIICGSAMNYAGMWSRVEGEENIWVLDYDGSMYDPGIIIFGAHLYDVENNYEEITGIRTFDYKTMYGEIESTNIPHEQKVTAGEISPYGYDLLDQNFEFYFGEPGMTEDRYDYHSQSYPLYVYYDGDLNADFDDIEIGEDYELFEACGANNVVIDGLCFKHTGGHMVRSGQPQTYGLTVTNCVLQWSGGSCIGNRKMRYGNAIETYGGCSDLTVVNNWIFEMFDTGITMQYSGETNKNDIYWENIYIADNIIEKCYWGMEYWCYPYGDKKLYADNIVVKNNVISNIANTWGIWQHTGLLHGSAMALSGIGGTGAVNTYNVITFEGNIFDRTYIPNYSPSKPHTYPTMFKIGAGSTLGINHKYFNFVDNYFIQYGSALIAKYDGDGNTYFSANAGVAYRDWQSGWTDFYSLWTEEHMSNTKVCNLPKRKTN